MAKANLEITQELKEKFLTAQDGTTRWLKLVIQGELIACIGCKKKTNSVEVDFNSMSEELSQDEACFFLFCDDTTRSPLQWTLIAFVPETSKVRDKMLYSSSREHLKRQLGQNYFILEFHISDINDMNYSNWKRNKSSWDDDKPFTESEILKKEHAELECDTNVKSNAMNVVPFRISEDLTKKLMEFIHGEINFVEMKVDPRNESVELGNAQTIDSAELHLYLDEENPRYIAFRIHQENSSNGIQVFIFSCPEKASTRLKMLYSTCKATVLSASSSMGLEFHKTVEVRDRSEVLECLSFETFAPTPKMATTFAKPARPGRASSRRGGRLPSTSFQ